MSRSHGRHTAQNSADEPADEGEGRRTVRATARRRNRARRRGNPATPAKHRTKKSAERTDGAHRRLCRKRATAPNLGFAQDADSTKERGTFCIRHLRKIKVKFGATARRRLRRRQSRECVGAEQSEVAAPRRAAR